MYAQGDAPATGGADGAGDASDDDIVDAEIVDEPAAKDEQ